MKEEARALYRLRRTRLMAERRMLMARLAGNEAEMVALEYERRYGGTGQGGGENGAGAGPPEVEDELDGDACARAARSA